MPLSWHQNRMKIYTQESVSPLEKGVSGMEFLLLVILGPLISRAQDDACSQMRSSRGKHRSG